MSQLSESQIDIIYGRLHQEGLQNVKLEQDLFDHFCCYVEEQMHQGHDFETAYHHTVKAVTPNGTKEIEFELYYIMNFNKQFTMKKLIFSTGFLSTFLLSTGLMLKILNVAASNVLLFGGFTTMLLTMILLAVHAVKFLGRQPASFWLRTVVGLASFILIAVGFIFRALHVPGSNILYGSGTVMLNFIFLPLFFYQLYKHGYLKTMSNETV